MKIAISAVALFCEDIREERSGAITLIGIVGDNVVVPHRPKPESVGILPRLGIYVRVNFDATQQIEPPELTVRFPDGETLSSKKLTDEDVKEACSTAKLGNPIAGLIFRIQAGNIPIKKLGRLTAEVTIGNETYLAGFLNLIDEMPTSPTASEQPS